MITVGNKIRKIREIKNLKQDYMAEQLGISVTAYGNIERGDTDVSMERLEQISKILDLSVQDILSFDEKKVFNVMHNQVVNNTGAETGIINYHEFSERLQKLYEENNQLLQDKIRTLEETIKELKNENEKLKSNK